MIRINRPDEPQILTQNKDAWTARLIEKIEEYKGYENIPDDEKKLVLSPYRHVDIKSSLFYQATRNVLFASVFQKREAAIYKWSISILNPFTHMSVLNG